MSKSTIIKKSSNNKINWKNYGRIIIFIDAANLENSVKDLGWWVDYKKLIEFFRDRTNFQGIYFYCPRFNSASQDRFFTVLKRLGYKLKTKLLKIIKDVDIKTGHTRKANFDVEIALDAVLLKDDYDMLILFSGDSDFAALAERLHEYNKLLIAVSSRGHISWELARASDKYIPLDEFANEFSRNKQKSPRIATGEVDDG